MLAQGPFCSSKDSSSTHNLLLVPKEFVPTLPTIPQGSAAGLWWNGPHHSFQTLSSSFILHPLQICLRALAVPGDGCGCHCGVSWGSRHSVQVGCYNTL